MRTNWAGNLVFGAVHLHEPESIETLRRIVGGCRHIRALGSGHSFSTVADAIDDLVLLDCLPQTAMIDPINSTVRVSAGMNYSSLSKALHRESYALANLASISDISIAGACATGTHGSGDSQPILAAAVVGIELVSADGDVIELRRDTHPDAFCGSVVSLGALGVATHLILRIEPSYEIAQEVRLGVPLHDIESRLDDVFGAAYSVSAFTDWVSGEVCLWLKDRVDQPGFGWSSGSSAVEKLHPIPGMSPELCTEQMGTVGPWHERLPHFRPKSTRGTGNELQSEYFVSRESAQTAIGRLREIGKLIASPLLISEIRTVRADDLWLSPAYGRDSVALHFTWVRDQAAVLPVLEAIEDRLLPLGARPHWGKMFAVPPHQVITSYERAADYLFLREEFDPTSKFRNAFVDGLLLDS